MPKPIQKEHTVVLEKWT